MIYIRIVKSFVGIVFLSNYLFAHQEWVHQHMTKAAYKLLRTQLGIEIPVMRDHMGLDVNGPGDGTWVSGLVVTGAWREDVDDPVWNVGSEFGGLGCGFVSSATHFWDADAGDESTMNLANDLDRCPYGNGEIPNAYQKALRYYYGGWLMGYNVSPVNNKDYYAIKRLELIE